MGFLQTLLQFFTNGYKVESPEYFKAVDTTLETEEELRRLLEESRAKVKSLEGILYNLATQVIDAVDTATDSLEDSGYTEEEESMTGLFVLDDKPLEDRPLNGFTDEEAAEYYSLV